MRNLMECSKKNIPSYGLYITMPEPQIIEMAKIAGYDFARLDAENISFDSDILSDMVRAARLLDFPLQICIESIENIEAILELGPAGIVVSNIKNREDVEQFVKKMKTAKGRIHTVVQIIGEEGLNNLESILSVPGVDMIATGISDLSLMLRSTNQIAELCVISEEERIAKTAIKYGKVPTLFAETMEHVEKLRNIGIKCFVVDVDSVVFLNILKSRIREFKAE